MDVPSPSPSKWSKKDLQSRLSQLLRANEDEFVDLIATVVKGEGKTAGTRGGATARGSTTGDAEADEEVHSPFGDLDPLGQKEHDQDQEQVGLINSNGKGNDELDQQPEVHVPFGESAYTLLFMHGLRSQSFWYALFVYALQISSISLTLIDVIDTQQTNNALQIPPMVSVAVTCAQAVALFLLAAYASDLIEAVLKIQDGYYPQYLIEYPAATFYSWVFSCSAQLCAGLLLLVASFILTMGVESVIDVMLNLTALLFMSEIDDLGFSMAKMGFITDQLQREAVHVIGVEVPKQQRRNIYRRLLYLIALGGLFAGYAILKDRQLNGYYLPTYLYIQFGEGYNFKIPYYSGIMTSGLGNKRTSDYRTYRDLGTQTILLSYCKADRAWTFSQTDDSCDYFARSAETTSYDVTSISNSEWEVKNAIQRLEPFQTFSLLGIDCDPDICAGTCVDGLCQCPPDRFGLDCGFEDICSELSIDSRTTPFPVPTTATANQTSTTDTNANNDNDNLLNTNIDVQNFPISSQFEILRHPSTDEYARAYNLPVFYSNKTYPANIILFSGLRWILTTEFDLINLTQAQQENPDQNFFPERTIATLNDQFHAYYRASYTTLFMSDPVDFSTPDFSATPAGLGWWSVGIINATERHYIPDLALESRLICDSCLADAGIVCAPTTGVCNQTTGSCDCAPGYKGDSCEQQLECYLQTIPCSRAGNCDPESGLCSCSPSYYGQACEFQYQCFEEQGICRNGGLCDSTTGSCDCSSDPSISGKACEVRQDCHIHGCQGGGLCAPTGQCLCQSPFYGSLCELVNTTQSNLFCGADSDCTNGGTCDTQTGLCSCNTFSGVGSLCQHTFNCISSDLFVCGNGGSCNNETGICDCPEPFLAPDCVRAPLCSNDGQCTAAGLSCDASTGTCKPIKSCVTNDCNNRGICNSATGSCECEFPYTGALCEATLPTENGDAIFDRFQLEVQRCGFPPYSNGSECASNMTMEYWNNFNV